MSKLVFDPTHNFFDHLPSFPDVFDYVARQVENIRSSPIKTPHKSLQSVSRISSPGPGSPSDSLYEWKFDNFSLPP